jgi:hypothetical protein
MTTYEENARIDALRIIEENFRQFEVGRLYQPKVPKDDLALLFRKSDCQPTNDPSIWICNRAVLYLFSDSPLLMVNPNPFLLLSGLARYVAVKVLHDESLFFLKLGMVLPGSANFPGSYLPNINLVPWEEKDE